jgi:hypothetical protein
VCLKHFIILDSLDDLRGRFATALSCKMVLLTALVAGFTISRTYFPLIELMSSSTVTAFSEGLAFFCGFWRWMIVSLNSVHCGA